MSKDTLGVCGYKVGARSLGWNRGEGRGRTLGSPRRACEWEAATVWVLEGMRVPV